MKFDLKNYQQQLSKLGIELELLEHPEMVEVVDVLRYLDKPISESFSTLVLKADKQYVAVIRRDDTKLNNDRLRKVLGAERVEMLSIDEFEELIGLPRGAAHILCPVEKTLIDKRVLEKTEVLGGCGSLIYSGKYLSKDLNKIPNSEVVDIADEKEEIEITKLVKDGVIKRVLSGITPSGSALHIGNYYGAVKPQLELAELIPETNYFVADLHALTTVQNAEQIEENVTGVVLDYLALGLDPEKCVFFRQSDVPEHSQLAVVMANYISYGQMKRMHAYKDKLAKGANEESINMGLFNYPILMAADILLYKPDGVPVGEDQRQHIELTRDMAENFNRTYGKEVFPLPLPLIREDVGRLVGTDGERKMSKSLGNTIGIFEDYSVIEKQIMKCFTDPKRLKVTDPGRVEGNPVFIYHDLINDDKSEVEELKTRYRVGTVGDVEVKRKLIEAHKRCFLQARERRDYYESHMDEVREILVEGAKKARQYANKTMREVYEVIGERNMLNT